MLRCCDNLTWPPGWIKSTLHHPVYKYNAVVGNLPDIYFRPETNRTWLFLGNMIEAFVDSGLRWDWRSCMWPSKRVTLFAKISECVQKTDCPSKQIDVSITLHVVNIWLSTVHENKKRCKSGDSHCLPRSCSIWTFGPFSQCWSLLYMTVFVYASSSVGWLLAPVATATVYNVLISQYEAAALFLVPL